MAFAVILRTELGHQTHRALCLFFSFHSNACIVPVSLKFVPIELPVRGLANFEKAFLLQERFFVRAIEKNSMFYFIAIIQKLEDYKRSQNDSLFCLLVNTMLSSICTLTILGLDFDVICSDIESCRAVCLPLGQGR